MVEAGKESSLRSGGYETTFRCYLLQLHELQAVGEVEAGCHIACGVTFPLFQTGL